MKKYPSYIVPLNIAKELKNIGFKDKVNFYYNLDKEYKGLYVIREPENFNKNNTVSIPVWEQVFEFFRKRGYEVNIRYMFLENLKIKVGYYSEIIFNNKLISVDCYYSSYENVRKESVRVLINIYKEEIKNEDNKI